MLVLRAGRYFAALFLLAAQHTIAFSSLIVDCTAPIVDGTAPIVCCTKHETVLKTQQGDRNAASPANVTGEKCSAIDSCFSFSCSNRNLRLVDTNQRCNFSALAAKEWLAVRLQMMGVVMVTAVAFTAVLERQFQSGGVTAGRRWRARFLQIESSLFFFSHSIASCFVVGKKSDEYGSEVFTVRSVLNIS